MTRRDFFRRLASIAGVVGLVPMAGWEAALSPIPGTYGAIDRATFPFWRNAAPVDPAALDRLVVFMHGECRSRATERDEVRVSA